MCVCLVSDDIAHVVKLNYSLAELQKPFCLSVFLCLSVCLSLHPRFWLQSQTETAGDSIRSHQSSRTALISQVVTSAGWYHPLKPTRELHQATTGGSGKALTSFRKAGHAGTQKASAEPGNTVVFQPDRRKTTWPLSQLLVQLVDNVPVPWIHFLTSGI